MADESIANVEYREIAGFPDYRVGSDGFIWSKRGSRDWRQLKQNRGNHGYCQVTLRNEKGCAPRLVHRVVLEAFVGPCPDGMEACHYPVQDRACNAICNLRWGTKSSNQRDRVFHGTDARGEKAVTSLLTEERVLSIRNRFAAKELSVSEAARIHGVNENTIRFVVKGITWQHVGGPICQSTRKGMFYA